MGLGAKGIQSDSGEALTPLPSQSKSKVLTVTYTVLLNVLTSLDHASLGYTPS